MINIIKAYSEPHRYYHNFNHISKMLINAERFNLSDKDLQTLRLAILYHDFVYIPSSKTNEQDSVDVFMFDIMNHKLLYDKTLISEGELKSQVMLMILDTIKHEPTFELSKYLIDLDLWELADSEQYKINSKLIRMEYIEYSEDIYVKARINWINSMLEKDRIYHTSSIDVGFESLARKNLKNELHNFLMG